MFKTMLALCAFTVYSQQYITMEKDILTWRTITSISYTSKRHFLFKKRNENKKKKKKNNKTIDN